MFGGKFGLAEMFVSLAIFGIFTLPMRLLWWVFSKKPFPWKRAIIGMGGLWAILMILSLFGC